MDNRLKHTKNRTPSTSIHYQAKDGEVKLDDVYQFLLSKVAMLEQRVEKLEATIHKND
jgi:hypothetical protein